MDDAKPRKRPPGPVKRFLKSRFALSTAGWAAANYLRLVYKTSRVIMHPADYLERLIALKPAIFTVWHGHGFAAIYKLPAEIRAKVLAARHGDGEIAAHALATLGIGVIRGAGMSDKKGKRDKGGVPALRAMLRTLSEGESVVMTADVPGGTPRRAGEGIVTLARLSGRPIIPTATASSRTLFLNTWSRFALHLPFSRFAVVTGEPITIPRNASPEMLEEARLAVEAALDKVNAEAYRIVGGTPPAAPADARARVGVLLKAYALLSRVMQPAAGFILRRRSRRGKEIEARLGERYGMASLARPAGPLWWFHAASVGELNAILPLLYELKARRPALNQLVTTVTVTSARMAEARLPDGAFHQFVPLDIPAFVARFFDFWRPDAALFTESEIWPNLILEADRRGVPLILVNARMSDRSFARWKRLRGLSRPLFSRFDLVLAQTPRLAKRLQRLGARRVVATGNIKFDAPPPPVNESMLIDLRARIGQRPTLLAASTHPGEDEIVLDAHASAVSRLPGLLTVIAPRHPERGSDVAALAAARGLRVKRRSQGEQPDERTEIYVADTIGELGLFYSLCPIAFIGGSLVPHGGQNPIEAIKLGAAVLSGPHQYNFRDAFQALDKCAGYKRVEDAAALARVLIDLYSQPHAANAMRERAGQAIEALSGGLAKTLDALAPYLPPLLPQQPPLLPPPSPSQPLSYAT